MSRYEPPARPQPYGAIYTPAPPTPPTQEPEMKSREQFYDEFKQVNQFYTAQEGLQRPGGMVIGGACDTEAMAAWGYNLMSGASVEDVKRAIRGSDEWRVKHQGEVPPAPTPGVLRGPISVNGRDFEVPS